MSIINDALKKTQKNLQQNSSPLNNKTSEQQKKIYSKNPVISHEKNQNFSKTIPEASKNKENIENKKTSPILLASLTISTIALIICFLLVFRTGSNPSSSSKTASLEEKASAKPSLFFSQTKTENSQLVLNGTMTTDNKKAALINNEIYEIGEYIEGWEIKSISFDKVTLSNGKKDLILKLRK